MNLHALPAVFDLLDAWSEMFAKLPELYTGANRLDIILEIGDLLEMSAEECNDFVDRAAYYRAAYARAEVFPLRVIESLSELCR